MNLNFLGLLTSVLPLLQCTNITIFMSLNDFVRPNQCVRLLTDVVYFLCFAMDSVLILSKRAWVRSSRSVHHLRVRLILHCHVHENPSSSSHQHQVYFSLRWGGGGGEFPNVGYMGMCHRLGSIFHLQKSRTGPKFLKFYSRTGPTF